DDINDEVVRRRLQVYHEETFQTLRFYDPSIIFEVNASQSPLKVHTDIVRRLCQLETDRQYLSDPPGVVLPAGRGNGHRPERAAARRVRPHRLAAPGPSRNAPNRPTAPRERTRWPTRHGRSPSSPRSTSTRPPASAAASATRPTWPPGWSRPPAAAIRSS